jgi:hypothetical protein
MSTKVKPVNAQKTQAIWLLVREYARAHPDGFRKAAILHEDVIELLEYRNRNTGGRGRMMKKDTLARIIQAHVTQGHIGSRHGHACLVETGLFAWFDENRHRAGI